MARSNTERARIFRERKREATKASPDLTHPFLKTPFFEYLAEDGNWSSVEMNFDLMGLRAPSFDDDSGPKSAGGEVEQYSPYEGSVGSIGRAEVMVGQLLDAAMELASIVNRYKLEEIDARIAEIEGADLSDPAVRMQALADIVQLNKIRVKLDKEFRRSFREINVKGTPSD
jgi:hypothetical protein